MNEKRDEAVQLLTHHLREIARRAGAPWSLDHDTEIAAAVDAIIEAAREPQQTEHQKAVGKMRDGLGV